MGEARNPAAPGGWKFQTTASVEALAGSASRELWSWFAVRRPLWRNAGQSFEQPCSAPMITTETSKQVSFSPTHRRRLLRSLRLFGMNEVNADRDGILSLVLEHERFTFRHSHCRARLNLPSFVIHNDSSTAQAHFENCRS